MRKLLLAGITVVAMAFTANANSGKEWEDFDFTKTSKDVECFVKGDMVVFDTDVDLKGGDVKDFPKIATGRIGDKDLEKLTVGTDMDEPIWK